MPIIAWVKSLIFRVYYRRLTMQAFRCLSLPTQRYNETGPVLAQMAEKRKLFFDQFQSIAATVVTHSSKCITRYLRLEAISRVFANSRHCMTIFAQI